MTLRVVGDTQDRITHTFVPKGSIITRANDYGKDMYSGVMGDVGVLVPMDDCAIVLEDLHE